jgi:DNA-binding PadR family transcriptional regulator
LITLDKYKPLSYNQYCNSQVLINQRLTKMNDRLLLLGILRQQQMHGYQLFEMIGRDLSACTELKKPTAYYLLSRMAQDGWIEERQEQEGNRPPRKVYQLTAQGETAFQDLLRESLGSFDPSHFGSEVGLAFLDALDGQEAIALLRKRRALVAAALKDVDEAPPHQGSLQWMIDHQAHLLKAECTWLDAIVARLE